MQEKMTFLGRIYNRYKLKSKKIKKKSWQRKFFLI